MMQTWIIDKLDKCDKYDLFRNVAKYLPKTSEKSQTAGHSIRLSNPDLVFWCESSSGSGGVYFVEI